MKKIIIFFSILVLSHSVLAQTYSHRLSGEYKLENSSKTPVSFSLQWDETGGKITGRYSDNYFTKEALVTGVSNESGRQLSVNLGEVSKGVRTISLLTGKAGASSTGTSVPVSVVTRDDVGNPMTTAKLSARFSTAIETITPAPDAVASTTEIITFNQSAPQREEQKPECNINFGELAGYCGIYGGLISEDSDHTNSCDLLSADDISLELDAERNLVLYLSPVNEIVNAPTHRIGQVAPNPENPIDVTSRTCAPLAGTLLPGDRKHCKRLNLTGTFLIERGRQHFAGTYTIYDETTKKICRYGLSLNKE